MPRRSRPQLEALHTALLAAFREVPDPESRPAVRYAAEKAGCSRSTAKRAFEVGLGRGLRSIRDLISEEKLITRSALRREQLGELVTQATEDAKADAIQSRARAGRLIVSLQESLIKIVDSFHTAQVQPLADQVAAGKPVEVGGVAGILQRLVASFDQLLRSEALVLGSPTSIVASLEVEPGPAESVSLEEAKSEIEAAARALKEAENAAPALTNGASS